MYTQDLVRFSNFFLKILSRNEILTSVKGRNSIKILRNMMGNNPKLDFVNADVHTKFGQILLIRSQVMEPKQNSDKPSRALFFCEKGQVTIPSLSCHC